MAFPDQRITRSFRPKERHGGRFLQNLILASRWPIPLLPLSPFPLLSKVAAPRRPNTWQARRSTCSLWAAESWGRAWHATRPCAGCEWALVEQHDLAFGTSSRSSRLLHGGLRYLAQGRFGLVYEASREKCILRRIAPAPGRAAAVSLSHLSRDVLAAVATADRREALRPALRRQNLGPSAR